MSASTTVWIACASFAQQSELPWRAAGHATDGAELWSMLASLAFGLLLLGLVLRALFVHHRLRTQDALGANERAELARAIAAAERRTSGELAVVVLGRSDSHPEAKLLAGLATLVLGSAALAPVTYAEPLLFAAAQCALFALGWLLARWLPGFEQLFVGEARASEMAEEQALQEFARLGLERTRGRTGCLLFVSLLERRAIVLGDEGIHAKVGAEQWLASTQLVLDGIRRESLRAGLSAGIASLGELLAAHVPPQTDERNELPDHLVVRES